METSKHRSACPGRKGALPGTIRTLAATSLALACCAAAGAATHEGSADAQARYRNDRAACMEGHTSQDRATCLREAGAALQSAQRGQLVEQGAAYEHNRFLRCNPLPAEDKQDCIRRMNGEGIVRGSVEEGGIYRELRTVVPAPAEGAPSARQ